MDINAKQQYMKTLREEYLKANKKGKTAILDEYCKRTKEERKYAIKKFRYKVKLKNPEERKHRPNMYKGDVIDGEWGQDPFLPRINNKWVL